jgi:HAD superfamily hydrolase (TIGR01450 family)
MRLDRARGFVFDLDGTLIQRSASGFDVLPGTLEVLAAIRRSGRPLAIYTNASHVAPAVIAAELREAGLPIGDDDVLTPICSALSYLARRHAGQAIAVFATPATRARLGDGGVRLVGGAEAERAGAVFVAHPEDELALVELDRAARAISAGARLLTGSYVPSYSGADGPIYSRGAMLTAALAKATGARPIVVGKPSRAAVAEMVARMGVPSADLVVIGDDVVLDVGLGRIGGSHTILVRTGTSSAIDTARLPERHRPHETIAGVHDLLARL